MSIQFGAPGPVQVEEVLQALRFPHDPRNVHPLEVPWVSQVAADQTRLPVQGTGEGDDPGHIRGEGEMVPVLIKALTLKMK